MKVVPSKVILPAVRQIIHDPPFAEKSVRQNIIMKKRVASPNWDSRRRSEVNGSSNRSNRSTTTVQKAIRRLVWDKICFCAGAESFQSQESRPVYMRW